MTGHGMLLYVHMGQLCRREKGTLASTKHGPIWVQGEGRQQVVQSVGGPLGSTKVRKGKRMH